MHYETKGGNLDRRELQKIFDRVIEAYVKVASLYPITGFSFDDQPRWKLSPGGQALLYKCDVEIAIRKVLREPELLAEWQRLVEEQCSRSDDPIDGPLENSKNKAVGVRSDEEIVLENRVTLLCGRIFLAKRLHRLGEYFQFVRRRVCD